LHGTGTAVTAEAHPVEVRVRVLGPLALAVGGEHVDVPGPRRRAVLALLAMAGGRAVSVDELLGAVWPDTVPDSGRRALHSHVSRLRAHLGAAGGRLQRDGAGYRLVLHPGELDADEVRGLAARARALSPMEAAGALGQALGLWRGTALEEFADIGPLAADAVALDSLRTELADALLEARLAAGAASDVVHEARRLVAGDPLRERTRLVLMRALAAEGRTVEAMREAHDLRQAMAEATGLEPSPALAELEREVAAGVLAPRPTGRATFAPPLTPIVGREEELSVLRALVAEQRLVTVIGPGGVGKTRLVTELGTLIDDREVVVVELGRVETTDAALDALGLALGLRTPDRVDVLAASADGIGDDPMILVLDNCEHLAAACAELAATLLRACPRLTVVATSREPLGLPGETLVRLSPLSLPGTAGEDRTGIASAPAVALFELYARQRQPGFALDDADLPVVAEIVRRLDGLPLALELAAGRTASLALPDLRDRLGRALDLLGRSGPGVEDRQRTLRSTIDWSYRLLPPEAQQLFRWLALAPGGFCLDAAEHTAATLGLGSDAAALVARLVDASMVVATLQARPPRYAFLETIRSFGHDELAMAGELGEAEQELARFAAALAVRLGRELQTGSEPAADARLRAEMPNLRAARAAAMAHGRIDDLVDLSTALDEASLWRDLPELWTWAIDLAGRSEIEGHPRRSEVLGAACYSAWLRGELDLCVRLGRLGLEGVTTRRGVAHCKGALASAYLFLGEHQASADSWLAAAAIDPLVAGYRAGAALAMVYAGEHDDARRQLAEAGRIATETGSPTYEAFNHYVAGELEAVTDPDAAGSSYGLAIELGRRSGATFVEGIASVGLVSWWTATGRTADALAGYRSLLDYWRRAGNWTQLWTTARNLAVLLAELGELETAALLLVAADEAPEAAHAARVGPLERAWARIEGEEGGAVVELARARLAALDRLDVVAEALAVLERLGAAELMRSG
jgi:predicted ATPase/DNA-binding SARP family transcriptional activator